MRSEYILLMVEVEKIESKRVRPIQYYSNAWARYAFERGLIIV